MISRAKWLTGVCLLAGCGGGGTNEGTADTSPPSVSISSSSASIEGGETVALTATASDAIDGVVQSAVSCSSGTVVGNLLVTSAVAADTSVTCTATATDRAGNTGRATTTVIVKATIARLSLATAATLAQGEFGALTAENLPLTATSYAGSLGGRPVTFYRGAAGALNYVVPTDLSPGTHRLEVTIGTRRYNYPLTIGAAPGISDPHAVAAMTLNNAVRTLDAFVAREMTQMTVSQRAIFQGYREQLTAASAQVASMSAADAAQLATLLDRNGATEVRSIGSRGIVTSAFNEAQCNADARRFATAKELAYVRLLTGLALIIVPEATLTKLAGLAVFVQALYALDDAASAVNALVQSCIDESEFQLVGENTSATRAGFVQALAAASSSGFENRKPSRFRLRETIRLNSSVAATVQAGFKQLTDVIAQLPYIPEGLRVSTGNFFTEKVQDVPAGQVSLSNISNPNIAGSLSGSGAILSLTFTYNGTPPAENIAFSFQLNRGGVAIPVSGQLVVALPGAEDAALTLIQGKATTSQLTVRGAETVEIVQAPSHGTATIGNDGALRYTPSGQYFGSDQLTYRARNANGVSRTATVLFTINRQFEGAWNISTRSTTSSQTSPGLCPNETDSFQIFVSKISDTQYTTSYSGYTINLTMASRDDAAGLRGSLTVTYDDDPGQTTETLSVSIPNSSQLTGTSLFQYRGPNNSACSGSTSVTGSKP